MWQGTNVAPLPDWQREWGSCNARGGGSLQQGRKKGEPPREKRKTSCLSREVKRKSPLRGVYFAVEGERRLGGIFLLPRIRGKKAEKTVFAASKKGHLSRGENGVEFAVKTTFDVYSGKGRRPWRSGISWDVGGFPVGGTRHAKRWLRGSWKFRGDRVEEKEIGSSAKKEGSSNLTKRDPRLLCLGKEKKERRDR